MHLHFYSHFNCPDGGKIFPRFHILRTSFALLFSWYLSSSLSPCLSRSLSLYRWLHSFQCNKMAQYLRKKFLSMSNQLQWIFARVFEGNENAVEASKSILLNEYTARWQWQCKHTRLSKRINRIAWFNDNCGLQKTIYFFFALVLNDQTAITVTIFRREKKMCTNINQRMSRRNVFVFLQIA